LPTKTSPKDKKANSQKDNEFQEQPEIEKLFFLLSKT